MHCGLSHHFGCYLISEWHFFLKDQALHSVLTLDLQFPWTLKFFRQHSKEIQNIFIIFSVNHLVTNFGCASFHTKPGISTQWAQIRKLSLIQFYDPSTTIPLLGLLRIYSHIYSPDFCFHELAKSLSSLVICILMDYTYYLPKSRFSFESGYSSEST